VNEEAMARVGPQRHRGKNYYHYHYYYYYYVVILLLFWLIKTSDDTGPERRWCLYSTQLNTTPIHFKQKYTQKFLHLFTFVG